MKKNNEVIRFNKKSGNGDRKRRRREKDKEEEKTHKREGLKKQ